MKAGPRSARLNGGEGYKVAEGTSNFGALVKDLHGEIDAAYVLKKAMEADLVATQEKLSKEQGARAQLETQIRGLEARVGLGDQLREDISLVEEEQNRTSRRLKEVASELKQVTEERDSIAKQKAADEKRVKELQKERFDRNPATCWGHRSAQPEPRNVFR